MPEPNAMKRLSMTVFKPSRRTRYIMRWTDPETGDRREESTGLARKRDAYDYAVEHARKILSGEVQADERLTWASLCATYDELVNLRRIGESRSPWKACKAKIDEFGPPKFADEITTAWVTRFTVWLTDKGLRPNTVASHLARLKATLRWSVDQDLLRHAPKIRVRWEEVPRSRAMTLEEWERMLAKVAAVRPRDHAVWTRFLNAHWACGWRISELARLSWDDSQPIHIDTSGKYPVAKLAPRSNKSKRYRVRPLLPEFWALCCETPESERHGTVFPILNFWGKPMSLKRVIKIIGKIGEKAGVVTNPVTGKLATSHDTRRAFAVRMDGRLTLAELQRWMDHADVRTTLAYYRTADAQDMAAKLWTQPSGAAGGAGPSTGNPQQDAP